MNKMQKNKKKISVKYSRTLLIRSTLTAMFIALAMVLKLISKASSASLSVSGVQISFGGIFTFFPAILFGPIYGGIASAMVDFLGAMFFPTGAYIPWLTVTAFFGGVIKGLVWRFITGKGSKAARCVLLAVFVCVACVGGAFGVSLSNDEIMNDGIFSVEQTDLPTKGSVDVEELSYLSGIAVDLAQYNKDVFTLKSVSPECVKDGMIILPAAISLNGVKTNITKIDKGAFSSLKDGEPVTVVFLSSAYKTVPKECMADLPEGSVVMAASDSAAFQAANGAGVAAQAVSAEIVDSGVQSPVIEAEHGKNSNADNTVFSGEGFSVKSSDAYRKYLAQYINFVTGGLMIGGAIGLSFILLTALIDLIDRRNKMLEERRRRLQAVVDAENYDTNSVDITIGAPKEKKRRFNTSAYMKIMTAITLSGLFVTTVNTYVLKLFLPAYEGRLFTVLLIPRVCEEFIVCAIQAYIICLVYGVVTQGKLGKIIEKL